MVSLGSCGAVGFLEGLLEVTLGIEGKAEWLGLKAIITPTTHTDQKDSASPHPQQFTRLKTFLGSRRAAGEPRRQWPGMHVFF